MRPIIKATERRRLCALVPYGSVLKAQLIRVPVFVLLRRQTVCPIASKLSVLLIDRSRNLFIPMNTVHWSHFIFSKKYDFLARRHLFSDCGYLSSRDLFEIKLLEEFWQEFTCCIKLKFVDALLLLSELAAKL